MDDFLTETWFIVLLGSILAIIIMSFAAMVVVKRKHMLMKQGSLGKCQPRQDKLTSKRAMHYVLNYLRVGAANMNTIFRNDDCLSRFRAPLI